MAFKDVVLRRAMVLLPSNSESEGGKESERTKVRKKNRVKRNAVDCISWKVHNAVFEMGEFGMKS